MHKDAIEPTGTARGKASHPSRTAVRTPRLRGIFIGNRPVDFHNVWTPAHRARLAEWVDLPDEAWSDRELRARSKELRGVEIAFATWGMPTLTDQDLDLMPDLRFLFYAGGSTKRFAGPFLARNIRLVSAWAANAIPVAEFTLSQILFSLKLGWTHVRRLSEGRAPEYFTHLEMPGVYASTVGLVSLGMIGRKVCELLQPFSIRKYAYDPVADPRVFETLEVRRCGLSELFAACEVVSVHAPWLPETEGLITGELIASMRPQATLINTARGAIIREEEMIEVLRARPDLTAILDVTRPEPPPAGSPLYDLPNVVLTPHIAGSTGREVRRMADLVLEEFHAWRTGKPLRYEVTPDMLAVAA